MSGKVQSSPDRGVAGAELPVLLVAAGAGDERAWGALVDRFGPMIWAVARSHRLSDADASDVAQTTWAALLANLDRITEPARIGAWLATTARRECLRVLGQSNTTAPYDDELPEAAIDCDSGAELESLDRDAALWRCFSRLRDGDRALLRMLMAEPTPSYEEISAGLQIPIGSIGPTRARALERLRRELARDDALLLMRA